VKAVNGTCLLCCVGLCSIEPVKTFAGSLARSVVLVKRTTYKDWINTDTRQILIETHGLPRPKKETITEWGTFPAMRASDYFDAFKQTGFVLFSKEVNSAWAKGECVEWSYLKLDKEFLGDSIARTSKY
jgi:hypothetical protein